MRGYTRDAGPGLSECASCRPKATEPLARGSTIEPGHRSKQQGGEAEKKGER